MSSSAIVSCRLRPEVPAHAAEGEQRLTPAAAAGAHARSQAWQTLSMSGRVVIRGCLLVDWSQPLLLEDRVEEREIVDAVRSGSSSRKPRSYAAVRRLPRLTAIGS